MKKNSNLCSSNSMTREREREIINNTKLISIQVNEFDLDRSASLNNKFKAKEGHAKGR